MRFSRRLSDEEIGEYLERASSFELAGFVSMFVLWDNLTDKGKVHAAAGHKVFERHKALFAGCDSGADIGHRAGELIDKWPEVSKAEASFLSDLVKAHRAVPNPQQQV